MPNVAAVLKEEISRIARKEIKATVTSLKKENIQLRRAVSDLKKQIADLTSNQKKLAKAAGRPAPKDPGEEKPRISITAKGIKSMRKKMQLSQVEFATLLGVSAQSITSWERKSGKLNLRSKTSEAVQALKGVGAREARARLEALEG